jgi:hypothetical protein
MTEKTLRSRALHEYSLACSCLTILLSPLGFGQNSQTSASDLIRRLARSPGQNEAFVFTCSGTEDDQKDRDVAHSLVNLGIPSLSVIEEALDSVERGGLQSNFSSTAWVLLPAYARIAGPSALPRLRRMMNNPALGFLQESLANAAAISLGLTAYIDSFLQPTTDLSCQGIQTRLTLDQLILAWLKNDRAAFEAWLGPTARIAWISTVRDGAWEDLGSEFPRGQRSIAALGYRFSPPGSWSEPLESFAPRGDNAPLTPLGPSPDLDAIFESASGGSCGTYTIGFRIAAVSRSHDAYVVDNSDLGGLLRLIASCAASTQ